MVKVVDFGLARVRSAAGGDLIDTLKAEPGAVFGTIDYISPEQAHDIHCVDIRSDLYSLGCSFYHLLTGQTPYPGGTPMEKLLKHRVDPIPAPVELPVIAEPEVIDEAARFASLVIEAPAAPVIGPAAPNEPIGSPRYDAPNAWAASKRSISPLSSASAVSSSISQG